MDHKVTVKLENTEQNGHFSLTDEELFFIKECVEVGFYCSEIDNAEELSVSILGKIKKVN